MRDKISTMRRAGTAAGAVMFILAAGCSVEAGSETTAHEIAERFAKEPAKGDAQARRRLEEERRKAGEHARKASEDLQKVEEVEMLARARAEAEQRRVEMMRARAEAERTDRHHTAHEETQQAEAARKVEEERRLTEARRQAEEEARAVEAAQQAEAARKADEERRLAEARKAEEEARAAEALRQAEILRKAAEEHRIMEARATEEARRQAEAQRRAEEDRLAEVRRAEEAARAAEARRMAEVDRQRARLEAVREAEAERLAERLRSAREEHEARTGARTKAVREHDRAEHGSVGSVRSGMHQLSSGATSPDVDHTEQRERRVTVLLLMQPGDRGIRRNNKSADPVLCGYYDCYVSNGPDSTASLLPARKALGFFRTWGQRAGACNNSLGCVFRGVDLKLLDGVLMPVDMRVVRHDRREPQEIVAASECRLERGFLACRKGIRSDDYDMWVVPESLAARAGPAVLMQALQEGLSASERTASAPPWSAR